MEDLEKKYNRTALLYDFLDWPFERFRYKKIRERIWNGLSCRILDAGVGTGQNIPFYPKNAIVIGVDSSEKMLTRARERASFHKMKIELIKSSLDKLPFPDGFFDYIVGTFICCLLKEPNKELSELGRVCRKDGSVYFLEYVLSQNPFHRFIQKIITPYTRFMYGVDFKQDTSRALKKNGFQITSEEYLVSDVLKLIIAKP